MIVVTEVTVMDPFSPVMVTEVVVEGMVTVTVVLSSVMVALVCGISSTVEIEKAFFWSGDAESDAEISKKVVDNWVMSVIVRVVSKEERVTVVVVLGTVTVTFVLPTSISVS